MKRNEENVIKVKKIRNIFLAMLGFLALGVIGGGYSTNNLSYRGVDRTPFI